MFLTRRLSPLGSSARLALVCLLGVGAACTSGVLPGDSYQQPLRFNAQLVEPLPEGSHPLLSVIWTDPLQRRRDVVMPPHWIGSTVTTAAVGTSGHLEFDLQLFRPPPDEALAEIEAPNGEVALATVGEIVVVDDANTDGAFSIDPNGTILGPDDATGDRYLAGTGSLLFYIARPVPTPNAPDPGPFNKPGYQMVSYECAGRLLRSYATTSEVLFALQQSRTLVEQRSCQRTHSP